MVDQSLLAPSHLEIGCPRQSFSVLPSGRALFTMFCSPLQVMQVVHLMGVLHLLLLHHIQQAALCHAASSAFGQPMRLLSRPLAGPLSKVEVMNHLRGKEMDFL